MTYLATTAIGGLMHEHQLILRVVNDMRKELERIESDGSVDGAYITSAVDFIRTYADRCHHGKEEDILFRDLETKPLSVQDRAAMNQLVEDHKWARLRTGELVEAADRCSRGHSGSVAKVTRTLELLVEFYPRHIEQEDHDFFIAAKRYLTPEELERMAAECADFERSLIHEKYLKVAEDLESRH